MPSSPLRKRRTAVLISGGGSNLQALLDAARNPGYPAEIALVISNAGDAYGLTRAREAGVPVRIIDHRGFDSRMAFEEALHAALTEAGIELVCLAGFMRVLTDGFVSRWEGRMLNVHPSLLPAFKGLHTHARALEAGVWLHGCSVHFVVPELDSGPLVIQAAVPVLPDDDEASLATRVLTQEHWIYPQALRWLAEGSVWLAGGAIMFSAKGASSDSVLIAPPLKP